MPSETQMATLWQDVRFALRTLRKNLSVTVLAILSLALAIAGNTTVYSLVAGFLHRPIPYRDVDRLALIGERNSEVLAGQLTTISPANYLDLAERQSSFVRTVAYQGAAYSLDGGGDRPEQLTAGLVTPGFFELLGVEPAWGRTFQAEEGVRGRDRVALLSYDFWQERYGGRTDLAGETLRLNGELYDVVGVAGEDFEWLLAPNTDVWLPLVLERGTASRQRRTLFAVGRLRDGVADEAAQAEMDALMAQLAQEHPESNRGYVVELLNMRHDIPDARNKMFFTLMQVALIFVLLIACANVANLLLSRSQAREREIAIRNSIGASRRRIVGQLFTESAIMALFAGVVGVALGYVGMRLITNALTSFLPSFWIPSLDARVLAYSLGVTLLGGVLFGLAPVLQTLRFDLLSSLKDGSQGASSGGRRRLASNLLVIAEIAFALAFLAGASMMIRTFQTMQTADPGFDTANVLIMQLDLPDARYAGAQEQVAGARQVLERLAGLPGVEAVTLANVPPRTPFLPQAAFEVEGRPPAEGEALPQVGWLAAGPGYFEALGIPIRSGRGLAGDDALGEEPVAVINEAMAQRYWPAESPLDRQLTIQGETRRIVGVVATVRHDVVVRREATPVVYLPWSQRPSTTMSLAVRTAVEPGSLAEPVRRELLAFDRNASLSQMQTLDDFVEQFWVGQRIFTAILGGFGLLALVLAALGTYGVLAYSVARRTQEIGIRMAIGAGRREVMRMILRQGFWLGLIGVALGIPLVLVQIRVISAIFAGFVPVEPSSVVGVALLLTAVTLVASALPAHRAASVDPIRALRWE
ncbi:MAG: ABC transporter permease [Acidobacteria bacterium]|nr:MAG: ABC transporter permease [Acidobacteriota bacterium]